MLSVYNPTGNERKEADFSLFSLVGHWITIMLERFCILAYTDCPLSGVVMRVHSVCFIHRGSEPGSLCSAV